MAKPKAQKPRKVSDEEVYGTIIAMCRAAGPEGSVRPEDVAREILPLHWRTLLKRVRLFSKKLAENGRIFIMRKGRPVAPDDAKGLIRLRISEAGMVDEDE